MTSIAARTLEVLIEAGALVEDVQTHLLLLPVYAELIPSLEQKPLAVGWFYFVEAGAEDQHHTHFRPYARVEVIRNQSIRFSDADGNMVAYIARLKEWAEQDVESLHWRLRCARLNITSTPEMSEAWANFIRNCRPEENLTV